jgi:regulator of cell morphogenesis and NO signaling
MLAEADPLTIVDYLQNSHSFYMDKEFNSLEKNITAMVASCDQMQKKIVARFFTDYKTHVANHFSYEENVVFPYVRALVAGKTHEGYTIEQFEENHSDIDEALSDLKNIVMKYLPDTCDTVLRNEVLYRIFRLEEDLAKHTVLEDGVLIPIVNRIEGESSDR